MSPDLHPRVLALLDEAKDHPDDDGPRLVLADWLQENGATEAERALGEFIYLQCRLAREPPDTGLAELRTRERELRVGYGKEWLGPWAARATGWSWERGLLRLRLVDLDWVRGPLARPAAFLWADGLAAHLGYGDIGERIFRRLTRSPVLAQLNHLDLDYNTIGASGVPILLSSPYLGRLTFLSLAQTAIGSRGVRTLAASPALAKLTALSLWGNAIDTAGVRALARSPHLGNLTRLDLRHNLGEIDEEARDALRARFGAGVVF